MKSAFPFLAVLAISILFAAGCGSKQSTAPEGAGKMPAGNPASAAMTDPAEMDKGGGATPPGTPTKP